MPSTQYRSEDLDSDGSESIDQNFVDEVEDLHLSKESFNQVLHEAENEDEDSIAGDENEVALMTKWSKGFYADDLDDFQT